TAHPGRGRCAAASNEPRAAAPSISERALSERASAGLPRQSWIGAAATLMEMIFTFNSDGEVDDPRRREVETNSGHRGASIHPRSDAPRFSAPAATRG